MIIRKNYLKNGINMKNRINLFYDKKNKEKIAILTAYDYATAGILSKTMIDAILIGDSLGMVFQGNDNTLSVTVDEMIYHCKAVRKGAPNAFLIGDMPFLSFHVSPEETVKNAGRLVKEGGVDAVKLEGGREIIDKITALLAAKIPVMGHLGLTPQSINLFGGYKVQAKTYENARQIIDDAILLEKKGVFAIVLEGIPEKIAQIITKKLTIPTIGIGAGRYVDGQVLVINDIFGLYDDLTPKFIKTFSHVGDEMKKGIDEYVREVKNGQFPEKKHAFVINSEIMQQIENEV